jgi:hypothetical protein
MRVRDEGEGREGEGRERRRAREVETRGRARDEGVRAKPNVGRVPAGHHQSHLADKSTLQGKHRLFFWNSADPGCTLFSWNLLSFAFLAAPFYFC